MGVSVSCSKSLWTMIQSAGIKPRSREGCQTLPATQKMPQDSAKAATSCPFLVHYLLSFGFLVRAAPPQPLFCPKLTFESVTPMSPQVQESPTALTEASSQKTHCMASPGMVQCSHAALELPKQAEPERTGCPEPPSVQAWLCPPQTLHRQPCTAQCTTPGSAIPSHPTAQSSVPKATLNYK